LLRNDVESKGKTWFSFLQIKEEERVDHHKERIASFQDADLVPSETGLITVSVTEIKPLVDVRGVPQYLYYHQKQILSCKF
jgi:hypothetical protein